MASRTRHLLLEQGEERFLRRMEALSTAERREVFLLLAVPRSAAASARQRTARRIQAAWQALAADADPEAAETLVRHYLARHCMPMIGAFLDALEVPHQDGYLQDDDALAGLSPERVAGALRGLSGDHDAADVRLYAALMELPDPAEEAA